VVATVIEVTTANVIVLQLIDLIAGTIQTLEQTIALITGQTTIAKHAPFSFLNLALLLSQLLDFPGHQLSAAFTLLDAPVLIRLALIDLLT
jgi:hypothetical protein